MNLFQCTKTPSKVSSKTSIIFEESFDTYADALYRYLKSKGIELQWLAKKITPEGGKVKSTQEKFSTWKRDGTKPNQGVRDLIDEILGVSIEFNADGKWIVSRTNRDKAAKNDIPKSIFNKDQEIKKRVKAEGIQYKDRAELIEVLQSRADTLSRELQEFSLLIGLLNDQDANGH